MGRPIVGIYAAAAPASWGPWRARPSVLAPAALATAVRQAGAIVVLIAPDPALDSRDLLRTLDALIVSDPGIDAVQLAALLDRARQAGVPARVLDGARVDPASPAEDFAREIAGLLSEP